MAVVGLCGGGARRGKEKRSENRSKTKRIQDKTPTYQCPKTQWESHTREGGRGGSHWPRRGSTTQTPTPKSECKTQGPRACPGCWSSSWCRRPWLLKRLGWGCLCNVWAWCVGWWCVGGEQGHKCGKWVGQWPRASRVAGYWPGCHRCELRRASCAYGIAMWGRARCWATRPQVTLRRGRDGAPGGRGSGAWVPMASTHAPSETQGPPRHSGHGKCFAVAQAVPSSGGAECIWQVGLWGVWEAHRFPRGWGSGWGLRPMRAPTSSNPKRHTPRAVPTAMATTRVPVSWSRGERGGCSGGDGAWRNTRKTQCARLFFFGSRARRSSRSSPLKIFAERCNWASCGPCARPHNTADPPPALPPPSPSARPPVVDPSCRLIPQHIPTPQTDQRPTQSAMRVLAAVLLATATTCTVAFVPVAPSQQQRAAVRYVPYEWCWGCSGCIHKKSHGHPSHDISPSHPPPPPPPKTHTIG